MKKLTLSAFVLLFLVVVAHQTALYMGAKPVVAFIAVAIAVVAALVTVAVVTDAGELEVFHPSVLAVLTVEALGILASLMLAWWWVIPAAGLLGILYWFHQRRA